MVLQWIRIASKLAPTKAGPYFSRCRPGRRPATRASNQQRHAYATTDGYRTDQGYRSGERGCAGIECRPTVTRRQLRRSYRGQAADPYKMRLMEHRRAGRNRSERRRSRRAAAGHPLVMTGLGRRFIDVGVLDVSGVRLAGLGHWAMAARTVPALHMRGHQRHCEQMQQNGKGRYPDRRTTRATHDGQAPAEAESARRVERWRSEFTWLSWLCCVWLAFPAPPCR